MRAQFDQRARLQRLDDPECERDMAVPRADDAGPGRYGEERVLRRVGQPVEGVVGQGLLRVKCHCARSGRCSRTC